MGGSESKQAVKQENNTLIVNENNVNILNERINNTISNTTIKDAQRCSMEAGNVQEVYIKGLKADGNIEITADQDSELAVSFSCINESDIRNEAGGAIVAEMMQKLEADTDANVLSQMEAIASNKAESGSISFSGKTKAISDISTLDNYESRTTNSTNLENIIKNTVEANFTQETIKECAAKIENKQKTEYSDFEAGGDILLGVSQKQASQLMADCIQGQDVGNKISNDIMDTLGIEQKSASTVTRETESSVKAEQTSEKTGVIDETFTGVASIVDAINPFSGMGETGAILSGGSCLLICICIFLAGAVFLYFQIQEDSEGSFQMPRRNNPYSGAFSPRPQMYAAYGGQMKL